MRDDPFFKDVPRKTLDMDGQPIDFPILYYDVRAVNAIFTARTSRLKKLLPHPNFTPIELWPGTALLGIAAFEYLETQIDPYNEIALAIPVKFPPGFTFPGISAASMLFKNNFSVYIHHLPVTTDIAYKAGLHFYNYPKFVSEITFQDHADSLDVTLKEKDELILKMTAKKLPLKKSVRSELHTYSIRENMVMHTTIESWGPKFGRMMMGKMATLELGNHPISRELADLSLSKTALSGTYAEGMMMKLHDPDKKWDLDTLELI